MCDYVLQTVEQYKVRHMCEVVDETMWTTTNWV